MHDLKYTTIYSSNATNLIHICAWFFPNVSYTCYQPVIADYFGQPLIVSFVFQIPPFPSLLKLNRRNCNFFRVRLPVSVIYRSFFPLTIYKSIITIIITCCFIPITNQRWWQVHYHLAYFHSVFCVTYFALACLIYMS